MNGNELKQKVDKHFREEKKCKCFFYFTYYTLKRERLEEKNKYEVRLNKSIFVISSQICPKSQLFYNQS